MDKYKSVRVRNNKFYAALDVHDFAPEIFYGCRNNLRNIIDKKNIDENDHVYLFRKKNGKLGIFDKTYRKAQLYLSYDWIYKNVKMHFKITMLMKSIGNYLHCWNLKIMKNLKIRMVT